MSSEISSGPSKPARGRIRALAGDALIYGIGSGLTRAIGFLLIPVYTRFLTVEAYGQLELLMVTATVAGLVATQGMTTAFFRFFPGATDRGERRLLVSTCYFHLVLSGAVIGGLIALSSGPLSGLLLKSVDDGPLYVKLIGLTVFFQMMGLIPRQWFRARMQPARFVAITLAGFVVQLVVTIYLVTVELLGVTGVLIGQLVSAAVIAVVTLGFIRGELVPRIDAVRLRALLAFGVPLIWAGLARWVLDLSDRVLLEKLATTAEVGLYSLGARFANILTIVVIGPFSTAWGAYCFSLAGKPDAQRTFGRIATYYLGGLCLAGLGIIVWMPPVIQWMAGREFWGAAAVVLPLIYVNVTAGMVQVFDLGVNLAGKTRFMARIMVGGALANVALNLLLIPRYGMLGAAVASLAAYLGIAGVTLWLGQRLYPVHFEFRRLVILVGVFVPLGLLGGLITLEGAVWDLAFRCLVLAAFPLALLTLGFLERDETQRVRRWFGR